MNHYYKGIIKEFIVLEIENYFENIEKSEKEDFIIKQVIKEYFNNSEIIFENIKDKYGIKESKTHIYRDRCKYALKENRCLARIWNCGMGGQCSRRAIIDGFCKYHSEPKTGPGKYEWWLGTINSARPERPINHKGKIHVWRD